MVAGCVGVGSVSRPAPVAQSFGFQNSLAKKLVLPFIVCEMAEDCEGEGSVPGTAPVVLLSR